MALHSAAQVLNDQEVAMSGPVGRIPWVRSALTGPGSEWMAGEHVGGNKRPVATQLEPWLPFDAENRGEGEVCVQGEQEEQLLGPVEHLVCFGPLLEDTDRETC